MWRSPKYSSLDSFAPDIKCVRIKYLCQGHLESLHWYCNLLNLVATSTYPLCSENHAQHAKSWYKHYTAGFYMDTQWMQKAVLAAVKHAKLAVNSVFMLWVETGMSPCPVIRLFSFLKPMGKLLFQEHPYNCSSKVHEVPSEASGTLHTVCHLGILQARWCCLQLDGHSYTALL